MLELLRVVSLFYSLMKIQNLLLIGGLAFAVACTKAPEAQQAETTEAQKVDSTATTAEELAVAPTSSVKWIG